MKSNALIGAVSKETGIIADKTAAILNAAFDILKEKMANGEEVEITYFGTFKTKFYGHLRLPAFIPGRDLKLIVEYNL